MVIFQDTRRFDLTLEAHHDAWLARMQGFVPGRLYPTVYLLQTFTTRQEALDALGRAWQRLFPDAAPLLWRDPPDPTPRPPRNRRTSGPRA